jgi:hypothetical protein
MESSITKNLMGGKGGGSKPSLGPLDDSEADAMPEGSEGEMAAEDFANAEDAAARYAAFKRMFKACEAEGHVESDESEDDEEIDY